MPPNCTKRKLDQKKRVDRIFERSEVMCVRDFECFDVVFSDRLYNVGMYGSYGKAKARRMQQENQTDEDKNLIAPKTYNNFI